MAFLGSGEVRVYAYGIDPLNNPNTDSLVLGHSTRGKIGATAANKLRPLNGGVFTNNGMKPVDLTDYCTGITITRGRRRGIDSFGEGRCTIELDSTDRRFDPLYTSGAYYVSNRQLFRKMVPIVVCVSQLEETGGGTATAEYPLFSGWIDVIDYTYDLTGTLFAARVDCIDAFGLLSRVDVPATDSVYGDGEVMGNRIRRWLEVAGLGLFPALDPNLVPDSSWTAAYVAGPNDRRRYGAVELDAGTIALQGTNLAANALNAVRAAAASSGGYVWPLANGSVGWGTTTTRGPSWGRSPNGFDDRKGSAQSIAVTFSEIYDVDDDRCMIENVRPVYDATDFANIVRMTRVGGSEQIAVNSSSVDAEGRSEYVRTDLLCQADSDVLAVAQQFLNRHNSPAVNVGFDTRPWLNEMAMINAISLELGDAVDWNWSQAGLTGSGFVSGIEHRIRPKVLKDWVQSWFVTLRL